MSYVLTLCLFVYCLSSTVDVPFQTSHRQSSFGAFGNAIAEGVPTAWTKLQREPRTDHEVDAVGHVPSGDQVREAPERLRPAGASVDEEPNVTSAANRE